MARKQRSVGETAVKTSHVNAPSAQPTVSYFSDHDLILIVAALPTGVDQRRLKLLPKILREWSRTDLKQHLSVMSATDRQEMINQLEEIETCATTLSLALKGRNVLTLISSKLIRGNKLGRDQIESFEERLKGEPEFLKGLGIEARALRLEIQRKRGRPRNDAAGLVLMDIIAIYEWLTNKRATRQVDRYGKGGKGEIGPFWQFAAAVWPLVFCKGKYGLSAALKKWARAVNRKLKGTHSPLIANITMRHPTWRVFKS